MKISVAMATYNGAKYLQEQLDSFIAQTRQPDELVVCDDGSTDETIEILECFANSSPFQVKVFINEKNIGYGQNFGRAISLCEGDLIFLSDQDDVWFREKIQTIQRISEEDKFSQVFMNDAEIVDESLISAGLTKLDQIRACGMSDSDFVMGCCMAVRKGFLKYLLPIPSNFKGHDVWLSNFSQGLECRNVLGYPLQIYRRHGNNESNIIANSLRKGTKYKFFTKKLSDVVKQYNSNSTYQHFKDIEARMEIMLDVANLWLKNEEDFNIRKNLQVFIENRENDINYLRQRMELREKKLISRALQGWRIFHEGGYRSFSGIKSYLRDIIF